LIDQAPARPATFTTMALFFASGFLYASWGVHVPTVRFKFHLDDGLLSLALFVIAAGSIAAITRVGPWIERIGTRVACRIGGLAMAVCAALILVVPTYGSLLVVLAVFGIGNATLDVAMNAQASAVESAAGRPIMSTLHGMFSVGGIAGAALGAVAARIGMAPAWHLGMAALATGATVLAAGAGPIFPRQATGAYETEAPKLPRIALRYLWLIGGVAMIALIAEGAMYDWSSVYMRTVVHGSQATASLAYAAFSTGMALGRFCGDRLRTKFGASRLILASAVLACGGLLAALAIATPPAVLAGFACMGLGLANMVPVLFVAAAGVPGVPPAVGLARVAGLAYFGMLLGPVLIGLVAQATNLTIGLAMAAGFAALIGALGPVALRASVVPRKLRDSD
jgi:MFS family permease